MGRDTINMRESGDHRIVVCDNDCKQCKYLSGRTDDKGYPYGYECMKYGDNVFEDEFTNSKIFKNT